MGRYQDALTYIFNYVNYEKIPRYEYSAVTFDLSRMTALCARLGDPQDTFASVHIAGTKGKGSTSAMTESVLRAAGYKTGLYTSPHLHTFRERIRLNGELIPKDALVALLDAARPAIEATPGITTFEIMTGLAFLYFAHENVDWAVLEVGLGGRLDATNVVHPAVCGITSLSYDHVELLGHTLSLIAWEKAGIIKAGVPVVSAPQMPEAMGVIQRVCHDTGARLVTVGEEWIWQAEGSDLNGQTLTVRRRSDGLTLSGLHIRLFGRHQLVNATEAVALISELIDQNYEITDAALRAGLAAARWPGRFEILNTRPALVLDSAHNRDSALKLRAALDQAFPDHRRLALVFGASSDKDIAGMLEVFLQGDSDAGPGSFRPADKVIATHSPHPRAADPASLADQARRINPDCPVSVQNDVDGALTEAHAWAGPNDVICVTGSIFVVARARRAWADRRPEAFPPEDWVFQDESIGEEPDTR